MNSSPQIAWVLCLVPALLTVAGISTVLLMRPLLQGKIGPNAIYGIRIPAAFRSEEDWYRINRLGGAILRRWGLLLTAIGLAGFPFAFAGVNGMVFYHVAATIVIFVSLGVATFRIFRIR